MNPNKEPTQFELAMLAAIVARRKEKPLQAVEYAWELWRDSGEAIQRGGTTAMSLDFARNELAIRKSWVESGAMPKKFPATLDDFLRLIVKAESLGYSRTRLLNFFRYQQSEYPQRYQDADERYAELKSRDKEGGCFADFQSWRSEASSYERWWMKQLSEKRAKAGAAPNKPKKPKSRRNPHINRKKKNRK